MGFLADVGKSGGVGQLGQNFLTGAVQAGEFIQNSETKRLMQQKAQMEMKQLEKDNAEYHIDAALSMYPEADRPFIKEALSSSGKIRPDGIVVGKDMREVPKLFEAYPKVAIGRGTMEFESLAKENEKLAKKGDPQSQQQMITNAQRMTEIKKHIQTLSGKEEVDKSFTLKQGETRFNAAGQPVASGGQKEGKVIGYTPEGTAAFQAEEGGNITLADGQTYDPTVHGKLSAPVQAEPKDPTDPTAIREFETVYPRYAGKRGTPEYIKGYEKFLELKGNRINAVTYLGQNEQGDFIVGKTRGVGAGAPPQIVANPAGGQLKPNVARPLGTQEQERVIGASNIAHVLPDMLPFRDLVRAKGGPIIDQVRGRVAEKMIDAGMGAQTGLPPEAINAHVAVTHLKTWATGMLKGAGSDAQRKQLIDTLPTIYDSADVIDQKMRKTINIVQRIATNTIQAAAAGGKAIPPDMYRQLADMQEFANQLGTVTGPSVVETRTLKDGTTWDKLSDGTFKQRK